MNMSKDQMQEQRVESKFVVSEAVAEQVSATARKHLVLDQHSLRHPDSSYTVHSLYLDSGGLHSYWSTVRRENNRFKLRIRFYDDNTTTPAYVEIKQRSEGQTLKQRCPVPSGELPAVLAGRPADEVWRAQMDRNHQAALENFITRMRSLGAAPKLHVAYLREAYVSRDNFVRLTLDREIRSEPAAGLRISTRMRQPRFLCEDAVVLEFKVVGPEPKWFQEMVENLGLRQQGFAKYVAAVVQHGLDELEQEQRPVSFHQLGSEAALDRP